MRHLWVGLALGAALATGSAQAAGLSAQDKATIDSSVREWLVKTQAPGVSIAVVRDGEIAYLRAYGQAATKQPATAATPYPIFSVSKEFTAAAILKLQEEGKLSLDDRLAKYFPDLTGADNITLRQLLNHSAGVRDFWPQDFIPIEIGKDATPKQIIDEWAKRPLDFEPGTDRQYSNTGFVIAAAIVERVSGQPLMAYLRSRIFTPLGVTVWDEDGQPLPAAAARGFTRFADGPIRPAPREGRGWMFGAGELAMTPQSLARWDISLMNRSLLSDASYDALYTPVKTITGKGRPYSLGLDVQQRDGRLVLGHGGAGSGYLTDNRVWPNEKIAIVAFTNNDWAGPGDVVSRVAAVVLPPTEKEARARKLYADFAAGRVDRDLFTDNANAFLTAKVLADQKLGLAKYGPARLFEMRELGLRGGMETRVWTVTCAHGVVSIVERAYPNGKIEQFLISRS
jgi:CubicO group peptidase (beta-lactamase class C family)